MGHSSSFGFEFEDVGFETFGEDVEREREREREKRDVLFFFVLFLFFIFVERESCFGSNF